MASVKFAKGSVEWYMFQDYWKLCQKFWIPENSDKYWDDVVKESREFLQKYEDITFSVNLIIALVDNLESRIKQEDKK